MSHRGILYVVATPIGNLQDISLRALDILRTVDMIAAEDTRHTSGLLTHFAIQKKLLAVHEHNEQASAAKLIEHLAQGTHIALVTDAGTPAVSDPGAIVVQAVAQAGYSVVPIPGASAVITALSASGIVQNGFSFIGFLPASGAQRRKVLQTWVAHTLTLVFYEAPHRIIECITDMQTVLGAERGVVIARELTKTFETFYRGDLTGALDWLNADANQQRGEFVVLVEPPPMAQHAEISAETEKILKTLLAELPVKQASKLAAEITGEKKNRLYDLALKLKE